MTEKRQAGRGVVLAPSGRVLLIRGVDPEDVARGGFWFTPGGGIDAGETIETGTRRELREELGLHVERLGPVLMYRTDRFRLGGVQYHQHETLFLVTVDDEFEPAPEALEELEASVITTFAWHSPAELRASREAVYPVQLADLVERVAGGWIPAAPWTEGLPAEEEDLTPEG